MDSIKFKCVACGSDQFVQPENPQPDDQISCAGCGATGRYGDIRDAAVKAAKEHVEKMLGDAFGKAFKKR